MTHFNALTVEEFTARVSKVNPQLKIIGEFQRQKDKILVEDQYGLLNVQAQSLFRSKPTIECAVDKTAYWINKVKEKYGDKFDYSKSVYENSDSDIIIICPIHGEFVRKPGNHFRSGCSKCAKENADHNQRKSFESFIEKSIERNGDIYEFKEIDFPFRQLGKLEVTCKECSNIFITQPSQILAKSGCPSCCRNSIHPESEGFIYQLVYDGQVIPYVGLTTRSLYRRLNAHKETVIKQRNNTKLTEFLTGKDMNLLSMKELECCRAYELKEKEDYWINILGTKYPAGLNKGGAGTGLRLKYIPENLEQPN